MKPGPEMPPEERLFQAALALPEGERDAFVRSSAGEDESLYGAVRMLLEGYAEMGGDEGDLTLATQRSARQRWASSGGEAPGTTVGPFRLVRKIGEGGMGVVWEAEQTAPVVRRVALKVMKAGMDTAELVRRFERERQALASMSHPHIAQVYEAGATELGRPYFAMELVSGQPIDAHCDTAQLDVSERIRLFIAVCFAVDHAHQKGMIHRDLKPSNILVSEEGVPKVIDFGIAKAVCDEPAHALHTRSNQVLGTLAYMSPEQAASQGADADTRCDVYSLGVILYELLTGSLPFDPKRLAKTSTAEVRKILHEEVPPRPSTKIRGDRARPERAELSHILQGDLDWVVMKAMAKERDRRYRGAAALAEDLSRFLQGEVVEAVPPTVAYRCRKFVQRNRAAVMSVSVVFIALAGALALALIQNERVQGALGRERAALHQSTLAVADLQANNGLNAARHGENATATLWFAQAAVTARGDAERVQVNRQRHAAWRQELRPVVRAFSTGENYIRGLQWNAVHPAILVEIENENTVQVWDLTSEARRWEAHGKELMKEASRAAWHPSGDRLTMANESQLQILEYPSGRVAAAVPLPAAHALSWHPSEGWVGAGGRAGITVWDPGTGELWRLHAKASPDVRLEFSRDGQSLLIQYPESTEIRQGRPPFDVLRPPEPSSFQARSLFLGAGARYVFTGHEGDRLFIADTRTGDVLDEYPRKKNPYVHRRVAGPQGRFLVEGGQDVIDLEQKALRPAIRFRGSHQAALSADGRFLAAGGPDVRADLWSLPDGEWLGTLGDPYHPPLSLEFTPDSTFLAVAERGTVRVFRVRTPPLYQIAEIPGQAPSLAALSPDGLRVVPSGWSGSMASLWRTRAFDPHTGQPAGPLLDPGGLILNGVFPPSGDWLALAVSTTDAERRRHGEMASDAGAGNVQLWDPRSGTRLGEPVRMPSEPRGVCVHPSGRWIGVSCAGGEGVEIDVATRTMRILFEHRVADSRNVAIGNNGRCAYSPDGEVLAVWGPFQTHHLWHRAQKRDLIDPLRPETTVFDMDFHENVVTNTVVAVEHRLEFRDVLTGEALMAPLPYANWPMVGRFDPTGEILLAGGGDSRAQAWEWRLRRPAGPPHRHESAILAAAFLPQVPWVVTSGYDSVISFWDHTTGRRVRPPMDAGGAVLDLKVSHGGRTLVVGGLLGGHLKLIDLERAFPEPRLDPEAALLLAEINAHARVDGQGGLQRLGIGEWFERWKTFRGRFPDDPEHRLGSGTHSGPVSAPASEG